MTEEFFGHIVARREISMTEPYAAGQDVETYSLLDPLDYQPKNPDADLGVPWDSHGWMKSQATRIAAEREAGKGEEKRRFRCTCEKSPSIATEYVDEHGAMWVIVGPERIPAAFRRSAEFDPAWRAVPAHSHPNGTPHIEITTCRRCRQTWVVAVGGDCRVQTARVRPTRGGTIAP